MNSDHVQRYHIRQDGVITETPNGKWIMYEAVEKLLNDLEKQLFKED